MMTNTYKIPKRYYIDHVECDCEAPAIIKETKHHYFISADETPEMAELRSRAQYYVDMGIGGGGLDSSCLGIVASARATLKIIGEDVAQSKAFEAAMIAISPGLDN
tara:strand:- start:587 stop:904 length:318 start_codon:yes stop_codon:yes gene_type:complete